MLVYIKKSYILWQEKPFLFHLLNNWRKFSSLYKVAYKLEMNMFNLHLYFSAFFDNCHIFNKSKKMHIALKSVSSNASGIKKINGAEDKIIVMDETIIK